MPKKHSTHRTVLAPRKAKPVNDKRLPYRDVPAFLRALRNTGAADATKDALEWLILTATRTNETLGARLSEVSEKTATWTVSPEREESNKERVVPLSARALEIFAACKQRHSGKGDFLFESKPGQPLSNMAMPMQMSRMKSPAVPHGFRYSFREWAADRVNTSREDAESRRKLMNEWSTYCASGGSSRVKNPHRTVAARRST
jgi:integrase